MLDIFGRSNVLSGIDFGLAFIKANIENKILMMSNRSFIPINVSMQNKNYRYEMEILTEFAGKEYRVLYGYEFAWKFSEHIELKIVEEYLKIKSETGRCSSKILVESAELVVNKLKAYDDIFYAEIIKNLMV